MMTPAQIERVNVNRQSLVELYTRRISDLQAVTVSEAASPSRIVGSLRDSARWDYDDIKLLLGVSRERIVQLYRKHKRENGRV